MAKALRKEIPYPLHVQEQYFWVQGTKAVSINLFKQGKYIIILQNNNGPSTENFSRRNSAICTGSPTTKRGSSCYPAGTTLHIILPQIQRTTNNNVVVCYHASSNTTQSCNHTNIICYIAKVNFYHSKTKKKMCLILNFSITTNRDIKLFVATCLAFYY